MASKRHLRRRACEGKKRYDTEEDANRAADYIFTYQHDDRADVYRCDHCGAFHVGHRRREYVRRDELRERRAGRGCLFNSHWGRTGA